MAVKSVTSIVVVSNLYLRIFLIAVGVGVSIHLFTLKMMMKEKKNHFK